MPHHLHGKLEPSLLHNGFLYDLDNFKEKLKKGKTQKQQQEKKAAMAPKKSKAKQKLPPPPPPMPPRPYGAGPTKRPKRLLKSQLRHTKSM